MMLVNFSWSIIQEILFLVIEILTTVNIHALAIDIFAAGKLENIKDLTCNRTIQAFLGTLLLVILVQYCLVLEQGMKHC